MDNNAYSNAWDSTNAQLIPVQSDVSMLLSSALRVPAKWQFYFPIEKLRRDIKTHFKWPVAFSLLTVINYYLLLYGGKWYYGGGTFSF